MGVDYHHYAAYGLKLVKVTRGELDYFLQKYSGWVWDSFIKILYPRDSYIEYYRNRLSFYLQYRKGPYDDPYVDSSDDEEGPGYFQGQREIPQLHERDKDPDISEVKEHFGDRAKVLGWVEVGYLC